MSEVSRTIRSLFLAVAVALMLVAMQAFAGERCVVCGREPVGQYVKAGGSIYCSRACFDTTLPVCAGCGKRVKGNYYRSGDKPYCSEACFETTLPVCYACGNRVRPNYMTLKDHPYCSKKCAETELPSCEICGARLWDCVDIGGHKYCKTHAELDPCEKCGLPAGDGIKLSDGRLICKSCNHDLVMDQDRAGELIKRAREHVAAITGLRVALPDRTRLVDLNTLGRETGSKPRAGDIIQRGMYKRNTETSTITMAGVVVKSSEDVSDTILILNALTPDEFLVYGAHELTHKLAADRFPGFDGAPAWAQEGLAQYIGASVARRIGNKKILDGIENMDDDTYGEGYKWYRKRFGEDNWKAVKEWLGKTKGKELRSE